MSAISVATSSSDADAAKPSPDMVQVALEVWRDPAQLLTLFEESALGRLRSAR